MSVFTATNKDIEYYLRQRDLESAGIDKYTKYLTTPAVADTSLSGYSQQAQAVSDYYNQLSEQAREQTSYDISGAYANYKKQQLGLLQNTQLGTGFKEQVSGELKSAYDQAYSAFKQEEASKLGDYASKLTSSLSEIKSQYDKQVGEEVKNYQDFVNYALDWAQTNLGYDFATEGFDQYGGRAYAPLEKGGYGLFTGTPIEGYQWSKEGQDLMYKILNSTQYTNKFLTDLAADEDFGYLADWYRTDPTKITGITGLDKEALTGETYEAREERLKSDFANIDEDRYAKNVQDATNKLLNIADKLKYNIYDFVEGSWAADNILFGDSGIFGGDKGEDKKYRIASDMKALYEEYGLDSSLINESYLGDIERIAKSHSNNSTWNKNIASDRLVSKKHRESALKQEIEDYMRNKFIEAYSKKYNK